MDQRTLGPTHLRVSALGLGCMVVMLSASSAGP